MCDIGLNLRTEDRRQHDFAMFPRGSHFFLAFFGHHESGVYDTALCSTKDGGSRGASRRRIASIVEREAIDIVGELYRLFNTMEPSATLPTAQI